MATTPFPVPRTTVLFPTVETGSFVVDMQQAKAVFWLGDVALSLDTFGCLNNSTKVSEIIIQNDKTSAGDVYVAVFPDRVLDKVRSVINGDLIMNTGVRISPNDSLSIAVKDLNMVAITTDILAKARIIWIR